MVDLPTVPKARNPGRGCCAIVGSVANLQAVEYPPLADTLYLERLCSYSLHAVL